MYHPVREELHQYTYRHHMNNTAREDLMNKKEVLDKGR
jgi:hypothetical protein